MSVQYIENSSAADFLRVNEDLLLVDESKNNLILGMAATLAQGNIPLDDTILVTLKRGDAVVGQALRTQAHRPLVITRQDHEVLSALAHGLDERRIDLAGVVGPKESCVSFSQLWGERSGKRVTLVMHQGIYETSHIHQPDYRGGKMTKATPADQETVAAFVLGFFSECFPDDVSQGRVQDAVQRHVSNGTLYLWRNASGQVVSMAAKNRESRNTATVSLVYTPPEHRGHGYASCIVAKLSQSLLESGKKRCNLYTDLTNTTSNSIYQKIGYRFIGESLHNRFVAGVSPF